MGRAHPPRPPALFRLGPPSRPAPGRSVCCGDRCRLSWTEPGAEQASTALLPPPRCCHLPSLSLSLLHWRRDSLGPSSRLGIRRGRGVNDHIRTLQCDRQTLKSVRKVRPRGWVIGGAVQTSSWTLGGGWATVNAVGTGPDGHSAPPASFTLRWCSVPCRKHLKSPGGHF